MKEVMDTIMRWSEPSVVIALLALLVTLYHRYIDKRQTSTSKIQEEFKRIQQDKHLLELKIKDLEKEMALLQKEQIQTTKLLDILLVEKIK